MINHDNPFKLVNANRHSPILYPKFSGKKTTSIRITEESYTGLTSLAKRYTGGNISELIELIGLFQLHLTFNQVVEDINSNTTNEDCRQAGYEDAVDGNTHRFLTLFGNTSTVFEDSYMQGYIEGNYIKTNDK